MKKIIFAVNIVTISILLITTITFGETGSKTKGEEDLAKTEQQISTPQAVSKAVQDLLKSIAARFAGLKTYLSKRETTTPQLVSQEKNTTEIPIAKNYDAAHRKLTLSTSTTEKIFSDVDSYNFSPQKRYLTLNTSMPSLMLRSTGNTNLFGYTPSMQLIDAQSGENIKTFDGKIITYEFSPDEQTLLIAISKNTMGFLGKLRNSTTLPSSEHASDHGRLQKPTGEILFYELFDIDSKIIFKTFENIQATTFTTNNELIVKYEDGVIEKIDLKKENPVSDFDKVMNAITPTYFRQKSIEIIHLTEQPTDLIETIYQDYNNSFTVILPSKQKKEFKDTISYNFSPHRKYLLIKKPSETLAQKAKILTGAQAITNTILISNESTDQIKSFDNVITYEFSPDEKTMLILTNSPKRTYTFFDIKKLKKNSSPYSFISTDKPFKEFTDIQSAYFKTNSDLCIIDKEGKEIIIDTETGETLETKQKRLQAEQLEQEKEVIEKTKQQEYESLSEEEKKNVSIENLPKKEREQKEYEKTIPGAVVTATQAIKERGFEAIKKAVSDIATETKESIEAGASKIATSIKEYVWPAQQPINPKSDIILPPTQEKESFEELEDIEFYMEKFQKNKTKKSVATTIIKDIVDYISYSEDETESKELVAAYNNYTQDEKKEFGQLFFTPPNGYLSNNSSLYNYDDSINLEITIVNEKLYVTDKKTKKIIFTTDISDAEIQAIAFNTSESCFALSYLDKNRIDVFTKTNSTQFILFKTINSENSIIGLRFINTTENNTYLFYLDNKYTMNLLMIHKKINTVEQTEKRLKPI